MIVNRRELLLSQSPSIACWGRFKVRRIVSGLRVRCAIFHLMAPPVLDI